MALRPGDLREKIDIQEVTEARAPGGGTSKSWNTVTTVWAQVVPLTGGEAFAQGIARSTQFYRIVIRHLAGITPRNRVVWNGQPLNIRTVADPDGNREALELKAESGAAEPA